ncbi:hypothetical protein [Microbacterium aurantiacum]|uniref:Uncharacterized protein n=1 Tax=Microbacterium aurantiacum TaxID=162393 RepID=A0A0M8MNS9_9MICO|nr:hypothetical protein [Microbacterium chocolatum]ANG84126.1 hypothetical protein A8L33_00720 [Microbacterium chocolatum]KOS10571.1 hypothetical protein XI38_10185 [Microbacterium chocolatum]
MRQRRRTFMIGGMGLVLCGVLGMLQYAAPGLGPVVGILVDLVFAAAVLLFAIGSSRAASVVARRPLGVAALTVVAVWPLAIRAVQPLLPIMDAATFDAGLDAYRGAETILTAVFFTNLLVSLVAGLLASVQIARAAVVPAPWNWAPLWAFAVSVVAAVIPQLLFAAAGSSGAQALAEAAILLGAIGFLARTLGLGILALVLAARFRSDSVDVYRSA